MSAGGAGACVVQGIGLEHALTPCVHRRNAEGADELLVPIDHEELDTLLGGMNAPAAAA